MILMEGFMAKRQRKAVSPEDLMLRKSFRLIADIFGVKTKRYPHTYGEMPLCGIVLDGETQCIFATNTIALVSVETPLPFTDVRFIGVRRTCRLSAGMKKHYRDAYQQELEADKVYPLPSMRRLFESDTSGEIPRIGTDGVTVGSIVYEYITKPWTDCFDFETHFLKRMRRLNSLKPGSEYSSMPIPGGMYLQLRRRTADGEGGDSIDVCKLFPRRRLDPGGPVIRSLWVPRGELDCLLRIFEPSFAGFWDGHWEESARDEDTSARGFILTGTTYKYFSCVHIVEEQNERS
jgi:hypothetical protein